jgi:diguanylate cyclase (GGDEF)-like protein
LQTLRHVLGDLIGPSLGERLLRRAAEPSNGGQPLAWRADVLGAGLLPGSPEAVQLLEANEQLVLSALRIQMDADSAAEAAAHALKEASRSVELDALTGLPNRALLLDRLAQAIAGARRRRARSALLFVDLNNFKQINDTLGHAAGDQALRLAAARLASSVRATDTVSRHGGDEFVILLADVAAASDALAIAQKLSAALGAPSRVGDQMIRLTASIGISLYPDDGEDAATLIERADVAMYRAKRQGLHSLVFRHEYSADPPHALNAHTIRQRSRG